MRLWIKDPLAMLADGGRAGIVVDGGRIVELVEDGGPSAPVDATFDASRHVVIPGLVNTHHHFFQTLTRAHPARDQQGTVPWLKTLYPIWGDHLNRDRFRLCVRLALTELLMSGCTTAAIIFSSFRRTWRMPSISRAEEAARLGMRMALTRGTINLRPRSGGIADER